MCFSWGTSLRTIGAATSSNNTGELTAIGEAITWISLQLPSTTSSYKICSDSTYALDAIDLTDPPLSSSSNKALIYWCLESLRTARRLGHLLLFRKVKAHVYTRYRQIPRHPREQQCRHAGGARPKNRSRPSPNIVPTPFVPDPVQPFCTD